MTPQSIGKKLRLLRKSRGMNQSQVAANLNIAQQSYSAYEKGIVDIPTSKLKLLAEYYQVSMDWLADIHEEDEVRNVV